MTTTEKEKGAKQFHQQKKVIQRLLTSANDGDVNELEASIRAILDSTANVSVEDILTDFKDAHKRSAIHFAALNGRRKVIAYILEHAPGALNAVDEDGRTPLLYAIKSNEFASAKVLLDAGANPNIVESNGTSCLHEAAAHGSVRAIKALLDRGANLNASTKNGTPLHIAVSEGHDKAVDALVEAGADVNTRNDHGITPLLLATLMRKPHVVTNLLRHGADMQICIMPGVTPLHVAAETGFADVVSIMLDVRADETKQIANQRTDAGVTPLQLAAGLGHNEVVAILKPLTAGFESRDTAELIATEQARVATESAEPIKAPKSDKDQAPTPSDIVDEPVEMPEAIEVDASAQANATALKDEGNKLFVQKKYVESIALYTQAIALAPRDPFLYSNRCAALLAANRAQDALRDVRISKALKPDWPKALFREGQCLEALKRYEDAACAMWAAMQLAPDDKLIKKRFQDCVKRGREEFQASSAAKP
ncbi:hypothetical protein H310_14690 [Aphanomyces invadans]|uniref:Uncharacterized protein n=1 Tax=Aphanomyces invadans TaxID=157072 RepID=A0A024T8T3_9STRA|nr:hypothetical protein H310_14690 [Aphanomyces invadans]ETV90565.1 hypothetical protein H310_14690 [Aphanomyces invadans]|eukprot:XP_008880815.1 hypothetical protein H310_14690 [Aphanomyces invadans]